MDLEKTIATLRAGGVASAEFYENGSVKALSLGPEQSSPSADSGDDDPAPDRTGGLRSMALRLASGHNLVPKHE